MQSRSNETSGFCSSHSLVFCTTGLHTISFCTQRTILPSNIFYIMQPSSYFYPITKKDRWSQDPAVLRIEPERNSRWIIINSELVMSGRDDMRAEHTL